MGPGGCQPRQERRWHNGNSTGCNWSLSGSKDLLNSNSNLRPNSIPRNQCDCSHITGHAPGAEGGCKPQYCWRETTQHAALVQLVPSTSFLSPISCRSESSNKSL